MNKKSKNEVFKSIPSVDELIKSEKGRELADFYGRETAVNAVRSILNQLRDEVGKRKTKSIPENFSEEMILVCSETLLKEMAEPSLRRAVNAPGIILHTGLGRAVFPPAAIAEINDAMKGYCTLAIDIETGQRGMRDTHIKDLICRLTGAEDSTIVNNNAAATILILNTLARNKEVIVSRGQLIEIGGSFRLPEVMEISRAVIREVGTTNKTHLKDYASAIDEKTGALLHVHQSNYRIVGFAEEPSLEDLIKLGKKHNLPVIDDLGSGALLNLEEFGLPPEPTVQESVKQGVSVVCFSGDKLIGGTQSGIIAGKAEFIEKIRKNPLARALRVDKITLAGMEATLKLFLNPEKIRMEHPVYQMMSFPLKELDLRAKKIVKSLPEEITEKAGIEISDGFSQIGSGSVPTEVLPSKLLSIKPAEITVESLARKLRYNKPPIFARIHKNSVLLDLRTIQPDEDGLVADAIIKIFSGG